MPFFVRRRRGEPVRVPLVDEAGAPLLNARSEPVILLVRRVPNSALARMMLETRTKDVVGGRMVFADDPMTWRSAVLREAIVGWAGVLDEDGETLPCDDAAKESFIEETSARMGERAFLAARGEAWAPALPFAGPEQPQATPSPPEVSEVPGVPGAAGPP